MTYVVVHPRDKSDLPFAVYGPFEDKTEAEAIRDKLEFLLDERVGDQPPVVESLLDPNGVRDASIWIDGS